MYNIWLHKHICGTKFFDCVVLRERQYCHIQIHITQYLINSQLDFFSQNTYIWFLLL